MPRKTKSKAHQTNKPSTVIQPPADLTQGRFLELLVEQFERYFGGEVEVKSPDEIPDRVTGEMREIDVSLRVKAGSTELLVMLECRNREGVEDVRWVEQVATKRDDVQAAKAIMVTNKPMSEPARVKAKCKGIATRTVSESTQPEDLYKWFGNEFVGMVTRQVSTDLGPWVFEVEQEEIDRVFPEGVNHALAIEPEDKVFRFGEEQQRLTINEIWQRECHHLCKDADELGPEKRPFRFVLSANQELSKCYYLAVLGREVLIHEIVFTGLAWVTETTETPTVAYLYRSENDEPLAKMLVHELNLPGHANQEVTIIHGKDGFLQLSSRPLGCD